PRSSRRLERGAVPRAGTLDEAPEEELHAARGPGGRPRAHAAREVGEREARGAARRAEQDRHLLADRAPDRVVPGHVALVLEPDAEEPLRHAREAAERLL